MATRPTIVSVVRLIAGMFPSYSSKRTDREWSEMIAGWQVLLHDIPDPLLAIAAVQAAARTDDKGRSFFPNAAQIRAAAGEIHSRAMEIPTAGDAWEEALRRARTGLYENRGGWYSPRAATVDDWSHPLIPRALDGIGGLRMLKASSNLTADRARFMNVYGRLRDRAQGDRYMLPCVKQAIVDLRLTQGKADMLALPDYIAHLLKVTPRPAKALSAD